jgi:hypothetical protein
MSFWCTLHPMSFFTRTILSSNISRYIIFMNASDSQSYLQMRLRRWLPMWDGRSLADRIGIVLSGACLVHCLVLPIVLPLLTMTADAAENPVVHLVLALLILPTTLWAARHGYTHHRNAVIVALLAAGGLIITIGLLAGVELGVMLHLSGEAVERVLTVIGSVLLVSGHWRNWQYEHSEHSLERLSEHLSERSEEHHAPHEH